MALELTPEEMALFDDISQLAHDLWEISKQIEGTFTDPKMISTVLNRRLWNNHKAFSVLWNHGLYVESDIILRSGLETAISIAANFRMGEEFSYLLRKDAAFTLQGQIRLFREAGDTEMVGAGEARLRSIQSALPAGAKAEKLNWKSLAAQGGTPLLYNFHRMLSGVSSHVTGVSVIRGVGDADTEQVQGKIHEMAKRMHLMMMAAATLQGSMIHAGVIEDGGLVQAAYKLTMRMNDLSFEWPGVKD